MNEIDNDTLPAMDDNQSQGQTEDELLAAVLQNSELAVEAGLVPPPIEEVDEVDPVESDEEVEDPESEEVVSEEETEEVEEEEEEAEAEDDTSTQDADVYTSEDLDLDAKVRVKVDGEEMDVSFADLLKGYQTDAHLSKKGREIGEAQKALEAEVENRLGQMDQVAQASVAMLSQEEQGFQKEYHEIEAQIEKARADGDTYEVGELKDKREQVQKAYWGARQRREGLVAAVQQHRDKLEQEQWDKQMAYFQETIPEMIPDFNEERAGQIRDFALDYGFRPETLDAITDPLIVKFIDEFRSLKEASSKGVAKRKAAPARKAVPTKKAKPVAKKKQDAEKMVKARAMREDATPEQQMDFLRQYASKTLNNL